MSKIKISYLSPSAQTTEDILSHAPSFVEKNLMNHRHKRIVIQKVKAKESPVGNGWRGMT
jgi:hypothetical protein